MSQKNVETEENEKILNICTFRGLKPEVFKRAHKKAKELELSGKVLLSGDWRKIVHQSWKEVKDEVKKVCPCNQPIDEKTEEESNVLLENQEDMPEEQHNFEEEAVEGKQAVEQDVDATSEQPPVGHIDAVKIPEENPEDMEDELEQTTAEEQEKPSAGEAGEKPDV